MAYRKKIHSSTGFAPYTLIFGKEMNDFESYPEKSVDNESQILQRNSEIQILLEQTRPKAIKNRIHHVPIDPISKKALPKLMAKYINSSTCLVYIK